MTRIVDLSMPLSSATQPPLDYPHLTMEPLRSHDRDGFESDKICQAIHTGTHIDARRRPQAGAATPKRCCVAALVKPSL